jgi:hypothetical protein
MAFDVQKQAEALGGLNDETALILSIKKWKTNRKRKEHGAPDLGIGACALCQQHQVGFRTYQHHKACGRCPLAYGVRADRLGCESSARPSGSLYTAVIETLSGVVQITKSRRGRRVVDHPAYVKACDALIDRMERALVALRKRQAKKEMKR